MTAIAPGLCRDCGRRLEPAAADRCPACASPRVVRHRELFDLDIAHLDCDAFYAAVEKRDDPTLLDKPLIIGGGRRGVVSTCCYVARLNGVHSAMPMFQAMQACPDAVVMRPNMRKYQAVGQEVRQLMRAVTPQIEPLSIDEAYLDLTEPVGHHDRSPAERLNDLATRVETELGITVSIGLSYNKFLAKLASDLDKPRGLAPIGRAEAVDFLKPLSVRKIWGVGPALGRRLAGDGITTIGQLQERSAADLARRYGKIGGRLAEFAHARDSRKVQSRGVRKSLSAETTFETDIAAANQLHEALRRLCDRVADRLVHAELSGEAVVLKLKTADFRIRTRQATLTVPTQRAAEIYRVAGALLDREIDGTPFRLIGVGLARMRPGDHAGGADPSNEGDLFSTADAG